MIKIYPFPALRATAEYASKVAAMSTGMEGDEALQKELEENPFSYLHIVKPHLHFNNSDVNQKVHYPFAKNYFRQMLEQNVIKRTPSNAMYIYSQTTPQGHIFEGLVTGISFINYLEGQIKKHENTLADKEERLMQHLQTLGAVGEPVLLACQDSEELNHWIANNKTNSIFKFNMPDGHQHEVFEILDSETISQVQSIFNNFNELYIADGHHRIAATTSYCTRLFTTQNKKVEDLLFMAYIIPESNLVIKSFHRLVANINQSDIENLWAGNPNYSIEKISEPLQPSVKGEIGMYYQGQWYKIKIAAAFSEELDVQFLDSQIFNLTLGIMYTRHDQRVTYLRGDTPLMQLEQGIKTGEFQLAFTLFPNTMEEIKNIADAQKTMPPKSTWIEPKLPTGMIIQRF